MNGKEDWEGIMPGDSTNTILLPDSCSTDGGFGNGNGTDVEIFEDGCFGRMSFIVSQSAMLVATGAITVAFVQVRCSLKI